MNVTQAVAVVGGLTAFFAVIHFVADWIFQTHAEAMAKHADAKVRAWHCVKYTIPFAVLFLIFKLPIEAYLACLAILFFSHFWEDSYKPVLWWFKHMRQIPVFQDKSLGPMSDTERLIYYLNQGPLGYILMIAIDQIVHLVALWVVALIIMAVTYK